VAVHPPKPPLRPGLAAKSPEDPLSKGRRDKEELEADVQRLEESVEELKVRYEMYFLGSERREPVRDREELKRQIVRMKGAFTRNAALRFRIQSLHARYLSYERLWLRAGREREEGTYRRDLFKLRLHGKRAPAAAPGKLETEDVDVSDLAAPEAPAPGAAGPAPAARSAGAAPTATPTPAARPSAAAPRLPETQLRELYDAYVAAKRRCNEDVSKLTYEAVARSVSKQVPELIARYQAKSVDFRVVIKGGKAILKAIPRV
jgi:hypothetical protein